MGIASSTSGDADVVGSIEYFLRDCLMGMKLNHEYKGPGRPRILPAMALWAGLLVCVVRGFNSQLAVWRLISERRLWFFPRFEVTDQAVYKRLHSAGTEPFERIFEHITGVLYDRLGNVGCADLAPFANEVVCMDESTLDKVARTVPTLRKVPDGDSRLLPGKLAGVFDVRRQLWRKVSFHANPRQNEKVSARELAAELPQGSLVLADLGYFGFAWFDWLTDRKMYWLSRLRAKTSYKEIHVYYRRGEIFDGIVWLGAHRSDRAKHAVRLVTFRQGRTMRRYITNVLEPGTLIANRDIQAVDGALPVTLRLSVQGAARRDHGGESRTPLPAACVAGDRAGFKPAPTSSNGEGKLGARARCRGYPGTGRRSRSGAQPRALWCPESRA